MLHLSTGYVKRGHSHFDVMTMHRIASIKDDHLEIDLQAVVWMQLIVMIYFNDP
jgi:hypothetical protein